MILDQCRHLRSRIADKKQLRLNVDQLNRFQKVRDLFAQHLTRLAPLLAVLRTLRDAGLARIDLGEEAGRAATLVETARSAFGEKPESLIDERSFYAKSFGEEVTAVSDRLERELQAAWQRYTEGKMPATNREVLDVLATAFPREVRQLRQRAERLDLTRRSLPKSAEELREFDAEAGELQRAWSQLGGGEVPASVAAFLRAAAAPAGAQLDLLTDEVRRWLAQHGIAGSFSVRVTNAGL